MKVKARIDTYPVPDIGQWVRATFEEGSREEMTSGPCFAMQFVELIDLLAMKGYSDEPIVGMPTKIAHNPGTKEIIIYPAPEKSGELYLAFFPPMVQI